MNEIKYNSTGQIYLSPTDTLLMAEPISFDNASMYSSNAWTIGQPPKHWPHTITGGTDRVLIVYVFNTSAYITSVTYGSQSMTLLKYKTSSPLANWRHYCWYLLNPNIGTSEITVTFDTNTGNCAFLASSYCNVRQTNTFDTAVLLTNAVSTSFTGYTYASGNTAWMVGCVTYNSSGGALTYNGATTRGVRNTVQGSQIYDSNGIIPPGLYNVYATGSSAVNTMWFISMNGN